MEFHRIAEKFYTLKTVHIKQNLIDFDIQKKITELVSKVIKCTFRGIQKHLTDNFVMINTVITELRRTHLSVHGTELART